MHFIRGLHNLTRITQASAVAIGNFDGVHLGHHVILQRLVSEARACSQLSVLVLFEPQPQEYFTPTEAPARLTRLREKLQLLRGYAIDIVFCLRFNAKLSRLTAEQFIQTILVERLQVRHLLVGDDFRFGQGRHGDIYLLKQLATHYDFQVTSLPTVCRDEVRISSTAIRHALAEGDLASVSVMLGRYYSLCGRVVYGHQRGRELGIPTANIHLHRHVVPLKGVYVVHVLGLGDKPLAGVANVGIRPTVGGTRTLLEVHLFDFVQDIYGAYVKVEFLEKLRDEKRYESLTLLTQQIHRDIAEAKQYFLSSHSSSPSGMNSRRVGVGHLT